MHFDHLLYDVNDEGVALVTIDRPEKLNVLDRATMDEIEQAITEAGRDEAVRAVIITGAGDKSFAAGADIREIEGLDATSGRLFALRGQAVFNRIERLTKPVIAAVNGFALGGGCELALACHVRTASEQATFGQPEVRLGIIPGYGGTQRLSRIIGQGRAAEMLLTGARIDARRAHDIGLVNRVFPVDRLIEDTRALAGEMITKAPLALSSVLQAMQAHAKEGLFREAELFGQCCATEDSREGVDAFLERRPPVFRGR